MSINCRKQETGRNFMMKRRQLPHPSTRLALFRCHLNDIHVNQGLAKRKACLTGRSGPCDVLNVVCLPSPATPPVVRQEKLNDRKRYSRLEQSIIHSSKTINQTLAKTFSVSVKTYFIGDQTLQSFDYTHHAKQFPSRLSNCSVLWPFWDNYEFYSNFSSKNHSRKWLSMMQTLCNT